MKHLILAAAFTLIAAPAFADSSVDATNAPKAKTFTDSQVGGYNRNYDASSNRAKRDAILRREEQNRSENSRAAVRGLPHYY